jgi:hypothetical protein
MVFVNKPYGVNQKSVPAQLSILLRTEFTLL